MVGSLERLVGHPEKHVCAVAICIITALLPFRQYMISMRFATSTVTRITNLMTVPVMHVRHSRIPEQIIHGRSAKCNQKAAVDGEVKNLQEKFSVNDAMTKA